MALGNSTTYSDHSSVEVDLSPNQGLSDAQVADIGLIFFKDASWAWDIESTKITKGGRTVGSTRGIEAIEASGEIYRRDYDRLIEALGDGFSCVKFDVTINVSENGTDVRTDILLGCRLVKGDSSTSEGADPLVVSIGLMVEGITVNGLSPLPNA